MPASRTGARAAVRYRPGSAKARCRTLAKPLRIRAAKPAPCPPPRSAAKIRDAPAPEPPAPRPPACSPLREILELLGWFSLRDVAASLRKRTSIPASPSAVRVLTATWTPRAGSRQRYTCPNPPRPSSAKTSYLLIRLAMKNAGADPIHPQNGRPYHLNIEAITTAVPASLR